MTLTTPSTSLPEQMRLCANFLRDTAKRMESQPEFTDFVMELYGIARRIDGRAAVLIRTEMETDA